MSQGGGDCEDWAEITAQLVQYWGWQAYIGCLFDGDVGHAICFVSPPDGIIPKQYRQFNLSTWVTFDGAPVAGANYTTVDYNTVGNWTNAVSAGMKLSYISHPDTIFGSTM